jgi:hypothetical protein
MGVRRPAVRPDHSTAFRSLGANRSAQLQHKEKIPLEVLESADKALCSCTLTRRHHRNAVVPAGEFRHTETIIGISFRQCRARYPPPRSARRRFGPTSTESYSDSRCTLAPLQSWLSSLQQLTAITPFGYAGPWLESFTLTEARACIHCRREPTATGTRPETLSSLGRRSRTSTATFRRVGPLLGLSI